MNAQPSQCSFNFAAFPPPPDPALLAVADCAYVWKLYGAALSERDDPEAPRAIVNEIEERPVKKVVHHGVNYEIRVVESNEDCWAQRGCGWVAEIYREGIRMGPNLTMIDMGLSPENTRASLFGMATGIIQRGNWHRETSN